MYSRIENESGSRARMTQRLSFSQPSVFDVIRREDYASDEAYIDALVAEKGRRSGREYQTQRRMIERELAAEAERKELNEQNKRFEKFKNGTTLSAIEAEKVAQRAQAAALNDVQHGRTSADNLSSSIKAHESRLTDEAVEHKAAGLFFNQMLRDAYRRGDE